MASEAVRRRTADGDGFGDRPDERSDQQRPVVLRAVPRADDTGVRSPTERSAGPSETSETSETSALPDPGETARALALCVVEILSGAREVDSIARWVTDDVHRHLQQRAALRARSRSVRRRSLRRPSLRAGSVVTCTPTEGVVEATVVVHGRSHARAVALRIEARNGRWRATAVGVL